jgi:adenylate cyclase
MLDKFIGDAVLAAFGFPFNSNSSISNTLTFSKQLIELGNSVMPKLLSKENEYIETGTRIGMSTGDIWAINIGENFPEITIIGNTISVASRLEKNSEVNGILIDNRTKERMQEVDKKLLSKLHKNETLLPPELVKGQLAPIRSWKVKN